MVLVRLVFQAKLGRAADVVAGMKQMGDEMQSTGRGHARHVRILTDLSGRFDTVVQELEYESIELFLQDLAAMSSAPASQADRGQGMELFEGGYKEYYTIEFEQ